MMIAEDGGKVQVLCSVEAWRARGDELAGRFAGRPITVTLIATKHHGYRYDGSPIIEVMRPAWDRDEFGRRWPGAAFQEPPYPAGMPAAASSPCTSSRSA